MITSACPIANTHQIIALVSKPVVSSIISLKSCLLRAGTIASLLIVPESAALVNKSEMFLIVETYATSENPNSCTFFVEMIWQVDILIS